MTSFRCHMSEDTCTEIRTIRRNFNHLVQALPHENRLDIIFVIMLALLGSVSCAQVETIVCFFRADEEGDRYEMLKTAFGFVQ